MPIWLKMFWLLIQTNFMQEKAAVVTNKIGKGTVTYIGVNTDDAQLERDILKGVYNNAQIPT
jgi:beta-galactosidase